MTNFASSEVNFGLGENGELLVPHCCKLPIKKMGGRGGGPPQSHSHGVGCSQRRSAILECLEFSHEVIWKNEIFPLGIVSSSLSLFLFR